MSLISRSFLHTLQTVVFVVDENLSGREMLAMLIRRAGWGPKTFASGEEFLAQPRLLSPSCLVLAVPLSRTSMVCICRDSWLSGLNCPSSL